jgi:hypothetical protein
MLSYIITFIYGFLSGFLCNYVYKLYNSYKYFHDVKKTLIHEAYSYLSNQVFNIIADDLITNIASTDITGIQNLTDFKNLIDSSVNITKDFNKLYKISIVDGKIQLKLNDPNYINNQHFAFICKFFTDNNVDLHIVINEFNTLENKLEYESKKEN